MAGKKKGCAILFLLIGVAVLFGANYWAVGKIGSGIREAILGETDFPPVLKGLSGVLPMGRFSADYLEVKSRIEEHLVVLKTTDISLHLDPKKYLQEQYDIRSLRVDTLDASYSIPEEDLTFQGRFGVEANSSISSPATNPPGSLWAERLEVQLQSLKAKYRNRDLDLIQKAQFFLHPFNLVPETGLQGETVFDFAGQLTPEEDLNLLRVKGEYRSEDESLSMEAHLESVQFPTRVEWLDRWLEEEGVQMTDLVTSGSASYRIKGDLEGDLFKGEMILRVLNPKFGPALRDLAKDGPTPAIRLMDLLEKQTEVVEIGPIRIEEDLSTPFVESSQYLVGGLASAVMKLTAKEEGGSVIDLFRDRLKERRSSN